MDQLARGRPVPRIARLANPVGEAVAAKPGEAHQVDVLRVGPVTQVAHQPAERGGGVHIVELLERVRIRIHRGQQSLCFEARLP